jgi:uncharacterized protein (TIGR00251 family)
MKVPPYLKVSPKGIIINLYVQPRSSFTSFAGLHESLLKLKVQQPPINNAANKACQQFLAKLFKVSKTSILLKSGANSRKKTFLITGISLEQALNSLPKQV